MIRPVAAYTIERAPEFYGGPCDPGWRLFYRLPLARSEPGYPVPAIDTSILTCRILRIENDPGTRGIVRLVIKMLLGYRGGVRPRRGLSDDTERLFLFTVLN